jgi:type VI secretion system protein ImpC
MTDIDFDALLERDFAPAREAPDPGSSRPALEDLDPASLRTLVDRAAAFAAAPPHLLIEAIIADLDCKLAECINAVLHHPDFQQVEATWRGLRFLVASADGNDDTLTIPPGTKARSSRRSTRRNTASSAADRTAC